MKFLAAFSVLKIASWYYSTVAVARGLLLLLFTSPDSDSGTVTAGVATSDFVVCRLWPYQSPTGVSCFSNHRNCFDPQNHTRARAHTHIYSDSRIVYTHTHAHTHEHTHSAHTHTHTHTHTNTHATAQRVKLQRNCQL